MKAEILKRCSVVCEPGSIVEVSERQFAALGDFAQPVQTAKQTEEPPAKKSPKTAVKKKEDK